jgi:ABC-type lipoprotein export system ATPase subunit
LSSRVIKKIMLMRALICQSPLIMLQEPWQNIETEYEDKIKNYLLTQLPNSTIIIVTNDADYINKCNTVIDLNKH